MKKEIVLFLMMTSVSVMNVAMNTKDGIQKETKQIPICCPRSYAVPPCEKCAERRTRPIEKNPIKIPLPLSSSRERERAHLPKQ